MIFEKWNEKMVKRNHIRCVEFVVTNRRTKWKKMCHLDLNSPSLFLACSLARPELFDRFIGHDVRRCSVPLCDYLPMIELIIRFDIVDQKKCKYRNKNTIRINVPVNVCADLFDAMSFHSKTTNASQSMTKSRLCLANLRPAHVFFRF